MRLPGGLWEGGERVCDAAFAELTGTLELAIGASADGWSPAEATTATLAAALAHIGGEPATPDRVLDLCVDDRRWLMQQLARELGVTAAWMAPACETCGEHYDVRVELGRLMVKPAGEGFPFATVQTAAGPVRVRVPTGRDQRAVAGLAREPARAALARRCVADDADVGDPLGVEAVERAVEAVSPEVTRAVETECPACGAHAEVPVDPYLCLHAGPDGILEDVVTLAGAFGWSEADTLALPRARRLRYLAMARDRGLL